jgi:hypothetical protein
MIWLGQSFMKNPSGIECKATNMFTHLQSQHADYFVFLFSYSFSATKDS